MDFLSGSLYYRSWTKEKSMLIPEPINQFWENGQSFNTLFMAPYWWWTHSLQITISLLLCNVTRVGHHNIGFWDREDFNKDVLQSFSVIFKVEILLKQEDIFKKQKYGTQIIVFSNLAIFLLWTYPPRPYVLLSPFTRTCLKFNPYTNNLWRSVWINL